MTQLERLAQNIIFGYNGEDKEKVFLEDGYYANAKGLYRKAIRIFNEKEGAK